jgi:hypothetical protein
MASWLSRIGHKTKIEGSDEEPVSGAVSPFYNYAMSSIDYWKATEIIRSSGFEPTGAQRRR